MEQVEIERLQYRDRMLSYIYELRKKGALSAVSRFGSRKSGTLVSALFVSL